MNFKCTSCGGEMLVSHIGDLRCPYCGSNKLFSDRELQEYKDFRLRILEYLSAAADEERAAEYLERLWSDAEKERDLHLSRGEKVAGGGFRQFFLKVTFPKADVKKLDRYFPLFAERFELEDGRIMIMHFKDENVYPVAMFLAKQEEWIISRLENIACVLAFNEMTHGGITSGAVFIKPKTHEAALYSNWNKTKE